MKKKKKKSITVAYVVLFTCHFAIQDAKKVQRGHDSATEIRTIDDQKQASPRVHTVAIFSDLATCYLHSPLCSYTKLVAGSVSDIKCYIASPRLKKMLLKFGC